MKRFATSVAGMALALAVAAPVSAQITGSAHDFNGDAWNTSGEICVVCHTPHNANPYTGQTTAASVAPLWNHELSTQTYTTYGAGYDMQSTTYNIVGTSHLCLSCHDGTVALENFGGTTGGTNFIGTVNPNADLTNDLSDDHPVGMLYDDAADTELNPTTSPFGSVTIGDVLGAGGSVECSSCHDVHAVTGIPSLLRISNAGSSLCLSCHIK